MSYPWKLIVCSGIMPHNPGAVMPRPKSSDPLKHPSPDVAATRPWTLLDVQNGRFREIAHRAQTEGPQVITLDDGPALIVSVRDEPSRQQPGTKPSLREVMLKSAGEKLDLSRDKVRGPVRDVEL